MDLAKFLSSLGSGICVCVWRSHGCLSDLGVVMVVMVVVMVLGGRKKTLAMEDLLSDSRKRTSGLSSSVG